MAKKYGASAWAPPKQQPGGFKIHFQPPPAQNNPPAARANPVFAAPNRRSPAVNPPYRRSRPFPYTMSPLLQPTQPTQPPQLPYQPTQPTQPPFQPTQPPVSPRRFRAPPRTRTRQFFQPPVAPRSQPVFRPPPTKPAFRPVPTKPLPVFKAPPQVPPKQQMPMYIPQTQPQTTPPPQIIIVTQPPQFIQPVPLMSTSCSCKKGYSFCPPDSKKIGDCEEEGKEGSWCCGYEMQF